MNLEMFGYVEIDRNSIEIRGSPDDDFTLNLWCFPCPPFQESKPRTGKPRGVTS
ncbi:hypothetical protein SLEP1_g22725 [Rubroshorea leprosula]|uniref:Uncharacterized protein n=1 Tax=Rubroshorea leprosula TaxID=152421 RepID=A0AAV5JFF4_9ROSI|nr:hypothetical protein SLEP1_g22725 [Rubroshorea leprosula]